MKPLAVGIDVGGSKIAAGLVRRDGSVLRRHLTRTHSEKEPEFVIDAIEGAFHRLLSEGAVDASDVEAVGLGFGGTVNGPAGLVYISSNLPAWDHYPLRDTVAARLGVPVVLDNDTNLCALAEHRYGAGRGARNMCYVTLSTGFGLGIIVDGEVYGGHTGTAGELAHAVVDVGGPPCTCGKRGCLMSRASGIAISRMAYEQIEAGAKTSLRDLVPSDGGRIRAEWVARAAREGDQVATEIIRSVGYYCGVGLSLVVQIINPELIVVGGGLTHIGPMLDEPMMAALQEHVQPELHGSFEIRPWQLGDDLGIVGAAAMIFAAGEDRQIR